MSAPNEKAILKVSFPNEKLEALRFYMGEKELTVEGELQKYVDNIYQKYVPAPTRRYLDRSNTRDELQVEAIKETTKIPGRKRNTGTQNVKEEIVGTQINNEASEETSEQNQEEDQGMAMSM